MLVKLPSLSRKPWVTPSLFLYKPTILPLSLMPWACVRTAPGTSIELSAYSAAISRPGVPITDRTNIPTTGRILLVTFIEHLDCDFTLTTSCFIKRNLGSKNLHRTVDLFEPWQAPRARSVARRAPNVTRACPFHPLWGSGLRTRASVQPRSLRLRSRRWRHHCC